MVSSLVPEILGTNFTTKTNLVQNAKAHGTTWIHIWVEKICWKFACVLFA